MDTFLEILKFLFCGLCGLLVVIVVCIIICWISASMETLHYTKQNNVLLKELCVENGLNVDSIISIPQKDTLNLKIDLKGE